MNIKKILFCISYAAYTSACVTNLSKKMIHNHEREEKHSDPNIGNLDEINNPLVIITGASIYQNMKNLPFVNRDIKKLINTFKNHYKYTVVTNFDLKNIHSQKASLKQMKNFIDKQVIYLRNNIQNHDSIIFTWSGYGYNDGIISSDGKELTFGYIGQRLTRDIEEFYKLPKIFILLNYIQSNMRINSDT